MNEIYAINNLIEKFRNIYNEQYFNGDPYAAYSKFKNGQCYQFAQCLQEILPGADLYINSNKDHVVVGFHNHLYDVSGLVLEDAGYQVMDDMDYLDADVFLQTTNEVTRRMQNEIIQKVLMEAKEAIEFDFESFNMGGMK